MTKEPLPEDPIEQSPRAAFLQRCADGQLAYQVSTADLRPVFYPRVAAPRDGSGLEWRESAGRGTVYASTTVRPRGEEPYNVSLVELDEGFRIMSTVTGIEPGDVRVVMRVTVKLTPLSPDGPPLPVFIQEEKS